MDTVRFALVRIVSSCRAPITGTASEIMLSSSVKAAVSFSPTTSTRPRSTPAACYRHGDAPTPSVASLRRSAPRGPLLIGQECAPPAVGPSTCWTSTRIAQTLTSLRSLCGCLVAEVARWATVPPTCRNHGGRYSTDDRVGFGGERASACDAITRTRARMCHTRERGKVPGLRRGRRVAPADTESRSRRLCIG